MLTATYQAKAAAHAVLHPAAEMADVRARDESAGRDEEAVVVGEERILRGMVDRRRRKRSSMLRWRIIGAGKRMGLVLMLLLNLPRLL